VARYTEPTQEQVDAWDEWLNSRPESIRQMVERYNLNPWTLYRLEGDPGGMPFWRVFLTSFMEPGARRSCRNEEVFEHATVTVGISGKYNVCGVERRVGPIDPVRLTECDLPLPTDMVGCGELTHEQVNHVFWLNDQGRHQEANEYVVRNSIPSKLYGDPNLQ
jgi:hypothetical protein